jgi:hypothetical protein
MILNLNDKPILLSSAELAQEAFKVPVHAHEVSTSEELTIARII